MAMACLPPDPQHAVLKRIYPWDDRNIKLILQNLYNWAVNTGFTGTYEDFEQNYGNYIGTLIEKYAGPYHIIPVAGIEQILHTANKLLEEDIIIDGSSSQEIYHGQYEVTPRAYLTSILRTKHTVLEDDITVNEIPFATTTNIAGGYTAIIG